VAERIGKISSRRSRRRPKYAYPASSAEQDRKADPRIHNPSIVNHGGGKGAVQPPPRPVVRDDHRPVGRVPVRPDPLRGEPHAARHGDPVRRLPLVPVAARGAGRREGRDARRRGRGRRRRRRPRPPGGGPEEGGRDALPHHRVVQPVRAVPRVQVLRQGDGEPGHQLLLLRHGVVRDRGGAGSGPRGSRTGGAREEDRVAQDGEPPAPGVGRGKVAVEDRVRLQPRRPAGVRGRRGVLRAVLLHEEVVPQQRPRDMFLPQGDRAVQPGIVQDRRHPARRAVLLRHLLGIRHGSDGDGGQEPRRPDQDPFPEDARSRSRDGEARDEPPRPRGHRDTGLLPRPAAAVRRAHRRRPVLPHGRERSVPEAVLPLDARRLRRGTGDDAVRYDSVRGRAAGAPVPGAGVSGQLAAVRGVEGELKELFQYSEEEEEEEEETKEGDEKEAKEKKDD
ncbi:hypothetical protein THAOC_05691, partial [Thalassiosira oceanica]